MTALAARAALAALAARTIKNTKNTQKNENRDILSHQNPTFLTNITAIQPQRGTKIAKNINFTPAPSRILHHPSLFLILLSPPPMAFKKLKAHLRRKKLARHGVAQITVPSSTQKESLLQVGEFDGWAVFKEALDSESVIYSFGIANKVEWDRAMIDTFNAEVHGFDPTPESIEWVAQAALSDKFIFHPYGLSNFDGDLQFWPPHKAGRFNYSQDKLEYITEQHEPIAAPVYQLSTIMKKLGHDHIDVLKIDIEGSEFEAIPNILNNGLTINQILIEIHYNFPTRSFEEGLALIKQLQKKDYHCFHISQRGFEFSFIHQRLLTDSE